MLFKYYFAFFENLENLSIENCRFCFSSIDYNFEIKLENLKKLSLFKCTSNEKDTNYLLDMFLNLEFLCVNDKNFDFSIYTNYLDFKIKICGLL